MSMHVIANEPTISPWRLWFGVLAGGSGWALQGAGSVLITSEICIWGSGSVQSSAGHLALLMVTLLCFATALAGACSCFAGLRRMSGTQSIFEIDAPGRQQYMLLIGLFANTIFLCAIGWASLPIYFLAVCTRTR